MIPKIIHQTAPADESLWHPIWKFCQQSWLRQFSSPEYDYRFWDDDDLTTLVKEHYPEYLELYLGYPADIFRIDIARFLILHRHGGIYADMDYYCQHNFYHGIDRELALVESPHDDEKYQNSLMASNRNHPAWLALVENARKYEVENSLVIHDLHSEKSRSGVVVREATGPILLSQLSENFDVHVLPARLFNPASKKDRNSPFMCTKHFLTGKWGCGNPHNKNLGKVPMLEGDSHLEAFLASTA